MEAVASHLPFTSPRPCKTSSFSVYPESKDRLIRGPSASASRKSAFLRSTELTKRLTSVQSASTVAPCRVLATAVLVDSPPDRSTPNQDAKRNATDTLIRPPSIDNAENGVEDVVIINEDVVWQSLATSNYTVFDNYEDTIWRQFDAPSYFFYDRDGTLLTDMTVVEELYTESLAFGNEYFTEDDKRPVVLFDGICSLCNHWVNFLLDWEPKGQLRFASMSSQAGRKLLMRAGKCPDDRSDIVLVEEKRSLLGTDAILRIFSFLDGPFPTISAFGKLSPHALNDLVYKTVSENRTKWFGQADACRLFHPGFKDRFLQ